MAKTSIQGFVELASGLGELTRARAADAVAEVLTLAATAPSSGKKVAKQAERMAEDLLTAATSNRGAIVAMIQAEVDAAVKRLDLTKVVADLVLLADTVQALGKEVERATSGMLAKGGSTAAAAVALAGDAPPAPAARRTPTSPTAARSPATKVVAKKAAKKAVKKAAAVRQTAKAVPVTTPAKAAVTKTAAAGAVKAATPVKTVAKKAAKKTANAAPVKPAVKAAPVKPAVKAAPVKKAVKAAPTTKPSGQAGS